MLSDKSERRRQGLCDTTPMRSLKIQPTTDYSKKEADSQMQKTNQWGREGGRDNTRGGDQEAQTTRCKVSCMDILCSWGIQPELNNYECNIPFKTCESLC